MRTNPSHTSIPLPSQIRIPPGTGRTLQDGICDLSRSEPFPLPRLRNSFRATPHGRSAFSRSRHGGLLDLSPVVTGDVFYNRKVDIAPKLSVHPGEEVAREVSCDTCDIVVCRLDDELFLHQVDAQEEEVPR